MTRPALLFAAVLALGALRAPPARAQDVPPGRVTLRPDEVDRAATRRLPRVRRCYRQALDRAPRSYGTIGVGFRIEPDGRVSDRWVALSTLGDPALEGCIVRAFDGLVFPAPGAPGAVARFGILLKTDAAPEAALKTQEEAYKRAIRDLPPASPRGEEAGKPGSSLPGYEGLDDREPFGPIEKPAR